jgi:hypothetical protein
MQIQNHFRRRSGLSRLRRDARSSGQRIRQKLILGEKVTRARRIDGERLRPLFPSAYLPTNFLPEALPGL